MRVEPLPGSELSNGMPSSFTLAGENRERIGGIVSACATMAQSQPLILSNRS